VVGRQRDRVAKKGLPKRGTRPRLFPWPKKEEKGAAEKYVKKKGEEILAGWGKGKDRGQQDEKKLAIR